MNFLLDTLGLLALRDRSVRELAARPSLAAAIAAFCSGFLVFAFIRNAVYANLRDSAEAPSLMEWAWRLNLIQALLYFALICVPILSVAGVALAGSASSGLAVSLARYRALLGVLFPLWGVLLALSAPVQALVPHWLVLGEVGISVGLLFVFTLSGLYTVWAVSRINGLAIPAAAGIVLMAALTLPVFYLMAGTTLVPLLLMSVTGILYLRHRLRRQRGPVG